MNFLNKNELIWNLKMLYPISSLSKILRKIETVDITKKIDHESIHLYLNGIQSNCKENLI